jgi:hypothetical protein
MATVYSSTGEEATEAGSSLLQDVEAKLRARGYNPAEMTYLPTDRAPRLEPVTEWDTYVLIQVFDSEPKTTLFPKAGFYHLRKLSAKDSDFLLKP